MLTRLVLKMLLKACVPLVAVIGVMSYMSYMQGGNPGAVLTKLFDSIAGSARQSAQQAGQSLDSLKPSASPAVTKVHKWVDANGVTHYGNSAPADVQSTTLRVNANVNLVAGAPKPTAKPEAEAEYGFKKGQKLPGGGGAELPVNLNRKDLTEFLEHAQRPSTER